VRSQDFDNSGSLRVSEVRLFQYEIVLKWNYPKWCKFWRFSRAVPKSLHSATYQQLTLLLTSTRLKSGLTPHKVADALKTHQSYIAKVEGGESRIDVVEFMELARVLGIAPSTLLKKLEAQFPGKVIVVQYHILRRRWIRPAAPQKLYL
jgi:transcriptional regulator with XRE-family HTH domain